MACEKKKERVVGKGLGDPCLICGESRETENAHFPKSKRPGVEGKETIPLCTTHHRLLDNGRLSKSEFEAIWQARFAKQFASVEEFVQWAYENCYDYSLKDLKKKFWDYNPSYYFAYASNLNKTQMRGRVGSWKSAHKGLLEGYNLTFDSRGKADILEDKNRKVHGVVYELTPEQMKKLDVPEGVESKVYKRFPVKVKSEQEVSDAIAYVKVVKTPFYPPEKDYLDKIITGLQEHGFDLKVIEEVKKIASGSKETLKNNENRSPSHD